MSRKKPATNKVVAPQVPSTAAIRLTQFSHGGGCGCKIAPGVLEQILAKTSSAIVAPWQLLVGIETSDDAAVYQLNDEQALVATTDFFMPIVDDPFDFGCIAATNALSDVYAMGGVPLLALADRRHAGQPVCHWQPSNAFSKAVNRSVRRPVSRLPVGIRSTRWNRSMALSPSVSCIRDNVQTQLRCTPRRPADSRQGTRSRLLQRSAEERIPVTGLLCGDDRIATTQINTPGRTLACLVWRACDDRCHRFWPARPPG
jgi:hypothetical protein